MPGSLAARDISKELRGRPGARPRVARRRRPATGSASSARTASASRPCCACSPGLEAPDAGRVVSAGAVGYLPQELEARPGETVRGYLARRTGVGAAEQEMDDLAVRLADEHDLAAAYTDALDRFLALGGEDFDARAASVLDDVGLGRRSTVSCGRSPAARRHGRRSPRSCSPASTSSCSTNRRTTSTSPASTRLERFLGGLSAGVVLVSHDRDFLDRTINRVVEIEAETRRVHEYSGTWTRVRGGACAGARPARGRLRRLRRREAAIHDTARGPAAPGAHAGRRAQAGAADRRRRPAGDERPPRQGQSGPKPPGAARRGREAVDAVAAADGVRSGAAHRNDRRARRARSCRSARSRSARSSSASSTATASRSSGRTARARRR